MLNERLKNKALGSYLCLAAALVALVTAIVFLATQAAAAPLGHTGIMPGIVLLAGVAAAIVFFLVPAPFGALVQAVIYNAALYLVVVQLYFVFADVINHVTYTGGNAGLCVFYMAGTFLACLLSVAACFFPQAKDDGKPASATLPKQLGALVSAGVAAAAVCVVGVFLQGNGGQPAGPNPNASAGPNGAGSVRMDYADNAFADKSIEDLAAIPRADWLAKEANGEVAYFFEGQYTEGFSTIIDPACLDMYCCKDGSMYGSFSGPTTSVGGGTISYVYGYWYNYNEAGEYDFVVHITGTQALDGTTAATDVSRGADADVFIFDSNHSAYGWEASLSYMMGFMTRNINIYGQEYAPAQSLTIDASNVRTFYTGDAFNPIELSAEAVRGNGSEETIWNGRIAYTGFDSETTGTKTVTGSFLGATSTFQVQVEQLVAEHYAGQYELVKDEKPTAVDATMLVDYSHKVCTVTAADGSASISGTLVEDKGGTLVITLNGSEPLTVTVAETDGVKQITIPAHQEVVSGWGFKNTYDIGECTLNIEA